MILKTYTADDLDRMTKDNTEYEEYERIVYEELAEETPDEIEKIKNIMEEMKDETHKLKYYAKGSPISSAIWALSLLY